MSGRKNNSQLKRILQEIGINGGSDNSLRRQALTSLIQHPSELADSEFLKDNDPLKIAARFILEDFEAVTNGMPRPRPETAVLPFIQKDPLYPWKLLSDAAAAFYEGRLKTMMEIVGRFPEKSAVSTLKSSFEILAGRPPAVNERDLFTEKIRMKNRTLSEGLDILDEAAAYPELLRKEIARYTRELSAENEEAGKRLYYWAMEVLTEEHPLEERDEIPSVLPGAGESSRICALASIRYDPDRALLAWLRSLEAVLAEGEPRPMEITARLKIADFLLNRAGKENLLTREILSKVLSMLNLLYPKIEPRIPGISKPPGDTSLIHQWLCDSSGLQIETAKVNTVSIKKAQKERSESKELFLFDEVC